MFYLIDKPLGFSSFDVLRKLRKILRIKKLGHCGTLDPLATGLLLVATEKSTKLIPLLETLEKRYEFTVRMDGTSESLDLGTPVSTVDTSGFHTRSSEEIRSFLESLTSQIPPRYSALHIDGKRAYELARAGEDFDLKPRPIQIRNIEISGQTDPYSLTLSLDVSSWGYIRSLAPVLSDFFWTPGGGYITALRRTEIELPDGIRLERSHMSTFEDPQTIPYSFIFPTIHTIDISVDIYHDLLNGVIISWSRIWWTYSSGRYFLKFWEIFLSLCEYDGEKFMIIRNDV